MWCLVVVHAFIPSIQEAEAVRSTWVQVQVRLQREFQDSQGLLHRETLYLKKNKNKQTDKTK